MSISEKSIVKFPQYSITINKNLKGKGGRETCQTLRKVRECYWMMKWRAMYPYGLSNKHDDEYKSENTHINVVKKFPSLPSKHNRISWESLH